MGKLRDINGQRFGKWTVTARLPNIYDMPMGGVRAMWQCRCDCGTVSEVHATSLHAGRSGQCRACYAVSMMGGGEHICGSRWAAIRHSAAARGIAFEIDRNYAWSVFEAQGRRCALSGIAIDMPRQNKAQRMGQYSASIDRIDSASGYLVGNIQWVHKTVNRMKGSLADADFIEWCRVIATNREARAAA